MIYKTNTIVFNFIQFETIRSFGESVFTGNVTLGEADKKTKRFIKQYFRI